MQLSTWGSVKSPAGAVSPAGLPRHIATQWALVQPRPPRPPQQGQRQAARPDLPWAGAEPLFHTLRTGSLQDFTAALGFPSHSTREGTAQGTFCGHKAWPLSHAPMAGVVLLGW